MFKQITFKAHSVKNTIAIVFFSLTVTTPVFPDHNAPSAAMKVCMETQEMEAALIDWYGEKLVSQQNDGNNLWASGLGGSWTVVSSEHAGVSCTVAQGDDWSPMQEVHILAQLQNE